jgi:CRP/FNR family transcriptional regulator
MPRRDRKLNALIKAAPPTEYRKGRILYRQGEPSELVLLVREGHVCLTLPKTGGERARVVGIAGPGELLGIEAVTLDVPRRYTAIAGSPCTVLSLNGFAVFKALRASPTTLSRYLRSADHDLAEARLISLSSGFSSKARIADVLLDLAFRFGVDDGRRIRLDHWFTHQELADLAGAHRSTVTTAINDWIYDGVLKPQPRGLIINKPGALRKAGTEASRKRKRKVATR